MMRKEEKKKGQNARKYDTDRRSKNTNLRNKKATPPLAHRPRIDIGEGGHYCAGEAEPPVNMALRV